MDREMSGRVVEAVRGMVHGPMDVDARKVIRSPYLPDLYGHRVVRLHCMHEAIRGAAKLQELSVTGSSQYCTSLTHQTHRDVIVLLTDDALLRLGSANPAHHAPSHQRQSLMSYFWQQRTSEKSEGGKQYSKEKVGLCGSNRNE